MGPHSSLRRGPKAVSLTEQGLWAPVGQALSPDPMIPASWAHCPDPLSLSLLICVRGTPSPSEDDPQGHDLAKPLEQYVA